MDIKDFSRELKRNAKEIGDLYRRKMPVYAGRLAKDHYQDNFRRGGFVNRGLHKWPEAKRRQSGSASAQANYGTLMSSRQHLFSSIYYAPGDARVKVANSAPHAPAHQNGETITIPVTPKMRRFAWAKHYEAGGGNLSLSSGPKNADRGQSAENDEADMWKGLALTKKTELKVKLPERPFIGESEELTRKIVDKGDLEVRKIINRG